MERRKIRWFSETQIVVEETGEIITQSEFLRKNYKTIKNEKSYELKNEIGRIKNTRIVRENEQTRLFN